ncbi:MAG: 16S rRNA processing protein RimM [Fimbriimonadia bacterium]
MARTGWFVIGQIVAPFGLRGEAKVECLTDLPERYEKGLRCWVGRHPSTAHEMRVDRVRWHKGRVLVKFQGVDRVEDVEPLRGMELFLPDSERADLPPGVYYDDDLIGLPVWTDDGRLLGSLEHIHHNAANDVYEVAGILIPVVKHVVTQIDLEGGRIVIHPIPGLLDDDER